MEMLQNQTGLPEPSFVLVSNKWNKNVFTNLATLRADGILCDVTLQGNDEKQLLAHSSVLAAASSVLKSCLVQAPRGHYVVKIPSISSNIWNLLLSYIYTGRVKVTSHHKQDMLAATQTLGLSELGGLCSAVHDPPPVPTGMMDLMDSDPIEPSEETEITIMNEPDVSDVTGTEAEQVLKMAEAEEGAGEGKNKYTCSTCGKAFPFGRSLLIHEMMHKEKKGPRHQCSKCDKTFLTYHSLRAHERTHRYLPFKCEICNAGFHFRVNYDVHKRKEHQIGGGEVHMCQYCEKTFMAAGLLNRHMAIVHKIKKEAGSPVKEEAAIGGKCVECNEEFEDREALSQHFKLVHRQKKAIQCSECDQSFKTVVALKEHFAEHSGEPFVKPFKCRYCDKRFLYKHAVMAHEKDSHEMKPQTCDKCSLTVKSEKMLQKHMKLHEGQVSDTLWVCGVCSKQFSDRPTYALHMAEHRGEKTYYCKYCSKGFPHKGNYSTHMQRHLGIKPYSCKFCSKTFVRKDDMNSHMRVHTGEKPFSCQVCGMKFAGVSNLREHERAKHNVSFSKRNPVTTPRQHRTKNHRGSKTVEHVDITQEGALADLADVVTGVLNTSKESPTELIIEQQMPRAVAEAGAQGTEEAHSLTVVQRPDGSFAQVIAGDQEQSYDYIDNQVYQVVMEAGDQSMKQLFVPHSETGTEGVLDTTEEAMLVEHA